ncbi:MAG: hypothetical protein RBR53_05595 [Desulforegulaceae bacterium]|nr:hypothetical protein [Desulforegulaceae bacterium]
MDELEEKFKNILTIDFEAVPGKEIYEIGAVFKGKKFRSGKIKNIKKYLMNLMLFHQVLIIFLGIIL